MSRPYGATPYTPDPAVYPAAARIPFLSSGLNRVVNAVNETENVLAAAALTFKTPQHAVEAQRSLFLPGAAPLEYDGLRLHEAGFNYFPEGVTGVASNLGHGLTSSKTYGFVFLYEYEDAKGVTHRSAPSVPISVTLGAGDNTVTLQVPYLRLSSKNDADTTAFLSSSIRIVGFRTLANGNTYFRDPPLLVSGTSDELGTKNLFSAVATMAHVSNLADPAIQANEILYTTGGGLENEAYPACTVCCSHQRRIFMVTQEEQSFVQYTDEIDERFLAPATNEVYRIPVPVEGGSVVGLASMDEKLIIFCQRRIYFIQGEGPNRLGQQNGYTLPQLCSSKMGMLGGCHESLALTPDGLWFMSSTSGLRMLTRGLTLAQEENQYAGCEVDGLIPSPVNTIRAATIDAKNQVRWYLSDSTVVVWDYMQHRWSHFTNHNASGGACSTRDTFWHSDGTSLFSSNLTPTGLDDTAQVTQVLETAWIGLAGLQGFQRVYSLMLLARAITRSTVKVEVGYDFNETYSESATYSQASAINPLQIEHDLQIQKCEAVRFKFTIVALKDGGSYNSAQVLTLDNGNLFTVGETVVGSVVGSSTSVVLGQNGSTLYVGTVTGSIVDGQTLTGSTSGVVDLNDGAPASAIFLSGTNTPVLVGQIIKGSSSGASATIATVTVHPVAGIVTLSGVSGTFTDGEAFTVNGSGSGESVRLTGLSLSVGVKRGLNKLAATKRF